MCISYQRKIERQERVQGNHIGRIMDRAERSYRASASAYWLTVRILRENGKNYAKDPVCNLMLDAMNKNGGELAHLFHSQNRREDPVEDENAYQEALARVSTIRDEIENQVNSEP